MTDSAWIVLAVATTSLALAASLVLLLVVLRRSRAAPADGAARELEQARGESRRAQRLAEIAATIDLDTVLQRTLAAAAQSAGVDAGMMVVSQEDDEPLVATRGLTAEEASRQPVSLAPPGGARALSIGYRYDARAERGRGRDGEPIRGGVAVPVRGEDGVLGTLAVFWRGEAGAADEEVARLEELAASSAPAIRNAQRFRNARRLASLDPLTGLGSRRAFHEALARECARAQRYERRLTIVLLDIDDFGAMNARIGPAAGDAVLAGVGGRLREAVRASDLAFRVGGDEFALVLPESGERDAEQLYRRIQFAVAPDAGEVAPHVRLSAGIAELDHADDPVSLLERADEALRRAREAGAGQVRRAELGS